MAAEKIHISRNLFTITARSLYFAHAIPFAARSKDLCNGPRSIPMPHRFHRLSLFILASALSAALPAAENHDFFEKRIRPLLLERCYQCHSADKKIKGGLRLDLRDGWVKGGDSGPAIEPGKPDDSL